MFAYVILYVITSNFAQSSTSPVEPFAIEEISEEKNSEGFICHPRFSPGYGDLSLDTQKKLLSALDSQRKIGITLTESLLMLPTKSVSAIIGLECRKGELLK